MLKIVSYLRLLSNCRKEPYLFWKKTLGFYPRDIELYQTAMRHSSEIFHSKKPSNERLEFVGDAMLSAVVGDLLYKRHPKDQEGPLTTRRAAMVKRSTLNHIAQQMHLDKQMHVDRKLSTASPDIYGNAFEALVGAIYYDRGYNVLYKFLEAVYYTDKIVDYKQIERKLHDYKSDLCKYAQREHLQLQFVVQNERTEPKGNTHVFVVEAVLGGKTYASGSGHTKRAAEQEASRHTLRQLKKQKNDAAKG